MQEAGERQEREGNCGQALERKQTEGKDSQSRVRFLPAPRKAISCTSRNAALSTPFSRVLAAEGQALATGQIGCPWNNEERGGRRQKEEKEQKNSCLSEDTADRLVLHSLSSQKEILGQGLPFSVLSESTGGKENKGEEENRDTQRREEEACFVSPQDQHSKGEQDRGRSRGASGGTGVRQLEKEQVEKQAETAMAHVEEETGNEKKIAGSLSESNSSTSGRRSILSTCSTGVVSGAEDMRSRPSVSPPGSWGRSISSASVDADTSDLPVTTQQPQQQGAAGTRPDTPVVQASCSSLVSQRELPPHSGARAHAPAEGTPSLPCRHFSRPSSLSGEAGEAAVEASLAIARHVAGTCSPEVALALPSPLRVVSVHQEPADSFPARAQRGDLKVWHAAGVARAEKRSLLSRSGERGNNRLGEKTERGLSVPEKKETREELHGRWLLPYELHFCCRDSLSPVDLGLAGTFPEHLLSLYFLSQQEKESSSQRSKKLTEAAWTIACDLKEREYRDSRTCGEAISTFPDSPQPPEVALVHEGDEEDEERVKETSGAGGTVCMLIAPGVPYALSLGRAMNLLYWNR